MSEDGILHPDAYALFPLDDDGIPEGVYDPPKPPDPCSVYRAPSTQPLPEYEPWMKHDA